MKIIIVTNTSCKTASFTLGWFARVFCSVLLLGIPVALGALINQHFFKSQSSQDLFTGETANAWKQALQKQKDEVKQVSQQANDRLSALTLKVAQLQARLVRLDALGERLTSVAKLDQGEFDFSELPAMGGPETPILGEAYRTPDFLTMVNSLADQIENRQQQLETLEALLANRKIQSELFVAGRPVTKGWISSRYGRRTDPFSGRIAWHDGVDFAGKLGSDIISVATGVVVWSGKRSGYGTMVEVNHGGGFSTRYAHNSKNLVKVGEVVKKGQVIALMGSSGRSTGPHVHFEVYKHGRAVDPASYIHRTHR